MIRFYQSTNIDIRSSKRGICENITIDISFEDLLCHQGSGFGDGEDADFAVGFECGHGYDDESGHGYGQKDGAGTQDAEGNAFGSLHGFGEGYLAQPENDGEEDKSEVEEYAEKYTNIQLEDSSGSGFHLETHSYGNGEADGRGSDWGSGDAYGSLWGFGYEEIHTDDDYYDAYLE